MSARRSALTALAAASLMVTMAGPGLAGAADEPADDDAPAHDPMTLPAGDWVLAWSDEFEGPAGTPPDPDIWGYDLGDGSGVGLVGWGNAERQWYTDEAANVALDGEGHVAIVAREADGSRQCYYGPCEYTSARLLTRDRLEFQHGYLEARLRVPAGFGLWPAFWLLGSNLDEVGWPRSGEIDVMEYVGRRPNELFGTVHGPGYSGSGGISGRVDVGAPVSDEFHTVGLVWEPDRLAWYLDGRRYHEVTREEIAPNEWVFEQPAFMLLNVAVGGNLGGPVFPDTDFPAQMLVDYVRLYEPVPA
ncbi:MAG: glycoside hydrolase family 16 protein [Candidatus Limnocylindrales bacterium]